jgi:NAD(P)H-flavin reductase
LNLSLYQVQFIYVTVPSTPLYQLVNHALTDKANTTKFKLLFSNVAEKDILLREELDALKEKYPRNFDVVYLVDAPSKEWTGELFPWHIIFVPILLITRMTFRSERVHKCRHRQRACSVSILRSESEDICMR